jgi:hypothetical protein
MKDNDPLKPLLRASGKGLREKNEINETSENYAFEFFTT